MMSREPERASLGGPILGWILMVGLSSVLALAWVRFLDMEFLRVEMGWGSSSVAALASVLLLAVGGALVHGGTLLAALLRNHRLSPRYAAALYGRPTVVLLHLLYPVGAVYGLALLGGSEGRLGLAGLGLLGGWALAGAAALLPYLSWLARDPEPEILAFLAGDLSRSLERALRKQDFSSEAKARLLQQLRDLGAIGQRAVLGRDPQRATDVMVTLFHVLHAYCDRKDLSLASWFLIESAHFPNLAPQSLEALIEARTWFELACLLEIRNVLRTGKAVACDLPADAAVLIVQVAIEARARKDTEALKLALSFLQDLLADTLAAGKRPGAVPELLGPMRRLLLDGLANFPALVDTLARMLASLALRACELGQAEAARSLLGELGHAAQLALQEPRTRLELGAAVAGLFLRLGESLRREGGEGFELWRAALLVLGVRLRNGAGHEAPASLGVFEALAGLPLEEISEALLLRAPPLSWDLSGFAPDRAQRDAISRFVKEVAASRSAGSSPAE